MLRKSAIQSPTMSSQSFSPATTSIPESLPLRSIPGSYGLPVLGPLSDRLDYFWFQGPEKFFTKRIEKHKSTVFRTNVPPTFPIFTGVNPNVIAVLDCKSFSHLFDMNIVEKKNVLVGDFMPSLNFTGKLRVCAYLDTTEPKHAQLKNFAAYILKRSSGIWVSEFLSNLNVMWDTIEKEVSDKGSSTLLLPLQKCIFRFLCKCITGVDSASSPEIYEKGYVMLDKWLALQLLPTVNIGILQPLEEIFLHSFTYPFAFVSGAYSKLYDFVEREGKEIVERGKTEFNLSHEETIHNLLFILGFNAFGGFSIFLPKVLTILGTDKTGLQEKLREEVRTILEDESSLSFDSVRKMELVQSFVYETLRLNPPVPIQYARARKDFVLSSHDSEYEIKKGELLCGYQPLVMRDGKVFDDPDSFISDRFTKEKGKDLLSYLYWSNGPQTGSPTESNKQCAAKDYVVLTACVLVADVFQRYDSITLESGKITAIEKQNESDGD